MTTFATRFRTFPSSAVVGDGDDASSRPADATMDASLRPAAATMDASITRPLDATMDASMDASLGTQRDASLPAVVDPSMTASVDGVRYDVKSVLGRGGMGEVRLCHDTRIGRDVAIKVAHARTGDGAEDGRARFLRESRVQGQLEHPAIVPVYDLEVFDDGTAYFAMKRVRGLTLAAILADLRRGDDDTRRRFPQRKLLAAFNSVCIAVDFAHTKGVVHRDIKPGNIMLGDFGEVYLLDWGLAKMVGHDDDAVGDNSATSTQGATLVGSVLGTPGYMAPEQIDASIAAVSPAADVYALGAVLFEILALERYIDAKDYVEATIKTLQGEERRPSKKRASSAVAVAPALDDVCARALQRAPKDRFASARALHDAIDEHLSGEHDLERRRALSLAHLAEAGKQADTDEGRAAALKELGSALALDPENTGARRALVQLLTTSPKAVPHEVQQRVLDDENGRIRAIARLRATSGIVFLPFVPFAIYLGIHEPMVFTLSLVALLSTSVVSALLMRSTAPHPVVQVLAHTLFLSACVGFSRIAGPFLLIPALLVAYSVEVQMHPHARQRNGVMLACCLAIIVAIALELSGLVPGSYRIVDGGILIQTRMVELNGAALWFFVAAAVSTILTPSLFAARIRGALAEAESKLHLQAWQLAQIVPHDNARADLHATSRG